MYHWSGFEHVGAMWLWWIIGVVLIIVIVLAVQKQSTRGDRGTELTPEEILKRRYASSEIDKDEYQQRLKDLRQ